MIRSTDRFLTTHTGSLPRPDDLIRMMYAKEEGVPVEREALATRVRAAVSEVVRKQADAGIDLVNDGELSKPSYATYVKDRLAGFGRTGNTFVYQDRPQFPTLAKLAFGGPGPSRLTTPARTRHDDGVVAMGNVCCREQTGHIGERRHQVAFALINHQPFIRPQPQGGAQARGDRCFRPHRQGKTKRF